MGRNNERTKLTAKYNPYQVVTRDQLVTIVSRLLYGSTYDGSSPEKWYLNHMQAMLKEGFITKPNPTIIESKVNILTILRRIADAIPDGSTMLKETETTEQKPADELPKAYAWAKNNDITPLPSYDTGALYKPLTRGELARMLAKFSSNILERVSIGTDTCTIENYTDFSSMDSQLQTYVKEVCNLDLMGKTTSGTMLSAFRPNDIVMRAEFATVISRMLYGNIYDKSEE